VQEFHRGTGTNIYLAGHEVFCAGIPSGHLCLCDPVEIKTSRDATVLVLEIGKNDRAGKAHIDRLLHYFEASHSRGDYVDSLYFILMLKIMSCYEKERESYAQISVLLPIGTTIINVTEP
jgi:hypothetical protein